MNGQLTGIDHPAVAAADVEELANWYCNVLGYERHFHHEKPVWMLRAPDGSLLEIMPRDDTPRPDRTTWTPGWSHLALRVKDIARAIEHLDVHARRLARRNGRGHRRRTRSLLYRPRRQYAPGGAARGMIEQY